MYAALLWHFQIWLQWLKGSNLTLLHEVRKRHSDIKGIVATGFTRSGGGLWPLLEVWDSADPVFAGTRHMFLRCRRIHQIQSAHGCGIR